MLCPFVNTGFQVLFHSPPGVLFTFPSRYCSSIGHQVVFSLGEWSPLLPTRFHVSCGTLDPVCYVYSLRLRDFYPLRSGFPAVFRSLSHNVMTVLNPGPPKTSGLGSSPFARRYSENRCYFLFLRLLRCFSSPGSPHMPMYSAYDTISGGFPHSDIHGSILMCSSPWLFAAYHVLLRLLMPRHPPYALLRLI